jgi:hypothetical protein
MKLGSEEARVQRLVLIASLMFLLTGCGGSEQSSVWRIDAEGAAWIQRDLIATETEEPVVDRYHYDVTAERVFVEARMYPKETDFSNEAVPASSVQFFGFGPLGMSIEEPGTKDEVSAVEFEPERTIVLSSSLLRMDGGGVLEQPYGDLKLQTVMEETSYEIERTSGLPFFGETTVEQVGDGKVRLELVNAEGDVLFMLEDEYVENSSVFTAMFTPDGRYVMLELPDLPDTVAARLPGSHRLVLVGELPITRSKLDIIAELSLTGKAKEEFQARQREKQQFIDGLITAEEYYGDIYQAAYRKVTQCADVEYIVGKIDSLQVREEVRDFGQPATVGRVYTFDYVAATSSGTLEVTVLDPEFAPRWASSYRQYLETIDIRSDTGVRFASCPEE